MLRTGGTATVIGMIPQGTTVELDGITSCWDRRSRGQLMGSNRFRIDIPRYVDLYLQGRLRLDDLVARRIALGRAPGRDRDVARRRGSPDHRDVLERREACQAPSAEDRARDLRDVRALQLGARHG